MSSLQTFPRRDLRARGVPPGHPHGESERSCPSLIRTPRQEFEGVVVAPPAYPTRPDRLIPQLWTRRRGCAAGVVSISAESPQTQRGPAPLTGCRASTGPQCLALDVPEDVVLDLRTRDVVRVLHGR